jgi:hypothetical protein
MSPHGPDTYRLCRTKRFISGTIAVALATGVLLACGATRPSPAQVAAAQQAWAAQEAAYQAALTRSVINGNARRLQTSPFTDPAVRADPLPCARAMYEADHSDQPYPRCYADMLMREQAHTVMAIPVLPIAR